jgi:hypothetical protein
VRGGPDHPAPARDFEGDIAAAAIGEVRGERDPVSAAADFGDQPRGAA